MQRRLLEKFLANASDQIATITAASTTADLATLGTVAHTLKSAARTVGAMLLGDTCQRLESAARGGDFAAAAALAQTLPAQLALTTARIQEHLAS